MTTTGKVLGSSHDLGETALQEAAAAGLHQQQTWCWPRREDYRLVAVELRLKLQLTGRRGQRVAGLHQHGSIGGRSTISSSLYGLVGVFATGRGHRCAPLVRWPFQRG
jgi:hypothetical protein